MVLSIVLASCGTAAPPTAPTTPTTPTIPTTPTTPTETPTQKEAVVPTSEAPKYGGTLTQMAGSDFTNWDIYYNAAQGLVLTALIRNSIMVTGQKVSPGATEAKRQNGKAGLFFLI